jgi:hypothetical protein
MKFLFTCFIILQFISGYSQTTKELVNSSNAFIESLSQEDEKLIIQNFNDSLKMEQSSNWNGETTRAKNWRPD